MDRWYIRKVKQEGTFVEKWTSPINQLTDKDLAEVQAALMQEACRRANEAQKEKKK